MNRRERHSLEESFVAPIVGPSEGFLGVKKPQYPAEKNEETPKTLHFMPMSKHSLLAYESPALYQDCVSVVIVYLIDT
jgi:hypothetical protein